MRSSRTAEESLARFARPYNAFCGRERSHDPIRYPDRAAVRAVRRLRRSRDRPARRVPVRARGLPRHVSRQGLDDAPVRGLRDRGGVERALPVPPRSRPDGAVGGLRPADADGLRLRRSRRRRRGRKGRRRDRLLGGYARAVRRDPAGQSLDVDDDQRACIGLAAALSAGRRGAGRGPPAAHRHDPERHLEGVHRARDVHLPARAVDAPHHRHVRVLRRDAAEVQHDLDQRLSHG